VIANASFKKQEPRSRIVEPRGQEEKSGRSTQGRPLDLASDALPEMEVLCDESSAWSSQIADSDVALGTGLWG
jgi:hypothetical protein